MVKLKINQQEIVVEEGTTVLQACQKLNIEVPVFCYHERLSVAGNCRMCLVEQCGYPKPIASCAMPVQENMSILTHSELVKKARRGVLEFLLINHPLDCPICDQGGECDLQDITMAYGASQSRFRENKRAVPSKDFGPLIKTEMTRCIHCMRCVRFMEELAGMPELGAFGRGEDIEIVSALDRSLKSEISGNIIDLCPVGALTSKPYAFKCRPWELKSTPSIDVFDAVGSNIQIECHNLEVMRILPRINEEVNEAWISDKARFSYDGLKVQRLDQPYVKKSGKLESVSWEEALEVVASRLKNSKPEEIAALVGNQVEAEAIIALKDVLKGLGKVHLDCRLQGQALPSGPRGAYLFNTTFAGLEEADACLLIGTNPRLEAPLLNTRLLKRFKQGNFKIGLVGTPYDLLYPYDLISKTPAGLEEIGEGTHPFSKILKEAQKPILIMGQAAFDHSKADFILSTALKIAFKYKMIQQEWSGFNVLHTAASRVAALDLGFMPEEGGSLKDLLQKMTQGALQTLFLLNVDEIDPTLLKNTFVIYQGHHGDATAQIADVILPGAAYSEKSGTYINTEGRVQKTQRALLPPGEAKEDWRILRALSEKLENPLPYDTLEGVRRRLQKENSIFKTKDIVKADLFSLKSLIKEDSSLKGVEEGFCEIIKNFYQSDPISRASQTMAACVLTHLKRQEDVF